ncbi:MAG: hypothetical protein WCL29_03705 [Pseudomonadota bacterium]
MEKVDVIAALGTEWPSHLILNPWGAFAQSMDRAALVEAGNDRPSQQVDACGYGIALRHRENGLHFALAPNPRQLCFFPEHFACFASILRTTLVRSARLNDRDHTAVDFSDQS